MFLSLLVIFQLGTDIIYTLSCIRDFKQEMLTTAVQDGLLEVCVCVGGGGGGGWEASHSCNIFQHCSDECLSYVHVLDI